MMSQQTRYKRDGNLRRKKETILWVHLYSPWSPWTNSGASRAICTELMHRGLLHAALAPDFVSRLYATEPGRLYSLLLRIQKRMPFIFPKDESWRSERDGTLGRCLRALPKDSAVVYVFNMPKPDTNLTVKRYLFLNLSTHDARQTAAFGHETMTEQQFKAACQHQLEMMSWVDGLVTPSSYAADSIARDFGYPREQITPFGYGSTIPFDMDLPAKKDRFERANILFVGRDWVRKGGPMIHKAWCRVRQELVHSTLTIVGPKKQPIAEEGVRFIGPLDKTKKNDRRVLMEAYADASVFCMPTKCEPWGLVFSEAAQSGLPIVSSRNWSLPDIVEDGVSGRLVDELNAEAISVALLDILRDPSRAQAMGRAAQSRYQRLFSWSTCVDRLLTRVMPNALDGQVVPRMQ